MYSSGTPRLQPTPGSSSGKRVRASRSARSSRSAWGMSIRNDRISVSVRLGSVMPLLLPPASAKASLIPSYTTLLYNRSVFQRLQLALRERYASKEHRRPPLRRTSENSSSTHSRANLTVMSGKHGGTQLGRGEPRRRLPEVGRRPPPFGPCPGGGSRRRCVR